MKKVFSLMLAVVLLVCVITPAFASTEGSGLLPQSAFEHAVKTVLFGEPDDYYMVQNGERVDIVRLCDDVHVIGVQEFNGSYSVTYLEEQPDLGRMRSGYMLGVPFVQQDTSNCWAAACAMIIGYMTGKTPTAAQVCNRVFLLNPDRGGDINAASKALTLYGLPHILSTGYIGPATIVNQIQAHRPMFLGCNDFGTDGATEMEHALVLCGYVEGDVYYTLYAREPNTPDAYVTTFIALDYNQPGIVFTLGNGRHAEWVSTLFNIGA